VNARFENVHAALHYLEKHGNGQKREKEKPQKTGLFSDHDCGKRGQS
jgi:hypothetical protein